MLSSWLLFLRRFVMAAQDFPSSNSLDALLPSLPILVRELGPQHRLRLLHHFLSLPLDDRQLRFGSILSDDMIEHYVNHIDFAHDTVFGIFGEQLELLAVGHLATIPASDESERAAEFGVSVVRSARGRGLGSALFQRAAIHSRNQSLHTLYMQCLSRNTAMMHIAKKAGMEVHYAQGEVDAHLKLPPANPASLLSETLQNQAAETAYGVRRNLRRVRCAFSTLKNRLFPHKKTA